MVENLEFGDRVEDLFTKDGNLVNLPFGKYFDQELFAFITRPDSTIEKYAVGQISSIRISQSKTIDVSRLKENIKIFEAVLKDGTVKYINYTNKYDKIFNVLIIGNNFASIDVDSITQARLDKPKTLYLDSIKVDTNYAAFELVLKDTRCFPITSIRFSYWGPYFTDAYKTMYIDYNRVDSVIVKKSDTVKSCFLATGIALVVLLLISFVAIKISWNESWGR
jgi:hypothetical protein